MAKKKAMTVSERAAARVHRLDRLKATGPRKGKKSFRKATAAEVRAREDERQIRHRLRVEPLGGLKRRKK